MGTHSATTRPYSWGFGAHGLLTVADYFGHQGRKGKSVQGLKRAGVTLTTATALPGVAANAGAGTASREMSRIEAKAILMAVTFV